MKGKNEKKLANLKRIKKEIQQQKNNEKKMKNSK